jgi:uncharacterized protein with GYD domain
MAKYMFRATYAAEGIRGLEKDKAAGRKAAVGQAIEALGGKMETFYFSFGEQDWVAIADLPDVASAMAFSHAVSSSGLLHAVATHLVTVEEMDSALQKKSGFKAPGEFTAR